MSDSRSSDDDWKPVGEIVRLQVQRDRLTGGEPNVYVTEPLQVVEALSVSPAGVSGLAAGAWVLDVHHTEHPGGHRFTPDRALSFGFTSHYDAMAERFGDVVVPGIAGENVVVAADDRIVQDDLAGGIRVLGVDDREYVFDRPKVAAPCAMFTRYLRRTPDADLDEIAEDRAFLHQGTRGFVMRVDGRAPELPPAELRVGDRVFIRGR